jgi:hypothetical protein
MWISCSDRLPEIGVPVLAVSVAEECWEAGDIYIATRHPRLKAVGEHTWLWDLHLSDDWYTQDYFTHWMPLPDPPLQNGSQCSRGDESEKA